MTVDIKDIKEITWGNWKAVIDNKPLAIENTSEDPENLFEDDCIDNFSEAILFLTTIRDNIQAHKLPEPKHPRKKRKDAGIPKGPKKTANEVLVERLKIETGLGDNPHEVTFQGHTIVGKTFREAFIELKKALGDWPPMHPEDVKLIATAMGQK